MSEKNGEKSRFQINRKRRVLQRVKIRELVAAAGTAGGKQGKTRRAKG